MTDTLYFICIDKHIGMANIKFVQWLVMVQNNKDARYRCSDNVAELFIRWKFIESSWVRARFDTHFAPNSVTIKFEVAYSLFTFEKNAPNLRV